MGDNSQKTMTPPAKRRGGGVRVRTRKHYNRERPDCPVGAARRETSTSANPIPLSGIGKVGANKWAQVTRPDRGFPACGIRERRLVRSRGRGALRPEEG